MRLKLACLPLLAALFAMSGHANADVTPTTILPFAAGMHTGDKLLWLNSADVMFVSGTQLMTIRGGEAPVLIANGVFSYMCPADNGTSVTFEYLTRIGGRFTIGNGHVGNFDMAGMKKSKQNCARGGGETTFEGALTEDIKERLQTPRHVFDLTVTDGKPLVRVHDKYAPEGRPKVFTLDWTLGDKLTEAKTYTPSYNPVTKQTVLYPLLDFEQKRDLWKANRKLPVLVYDGVNLTRTNVPWFNALERTNYDMIARNHQIVVATSWTADEKGRNDKAGIWLMHNGIMERLYNGRVMQGSMAMNPNGMTLGFIEQNEPKGGVPMTTAIQVLPLK